MSKGAGKQTTTTAVDPATAARQQEIWQRAQTASNQPYTPYQGQQVAGVSDLSTGAAGQFRDASQATLGQGAAAMGGDPAAQARFFNPYQKQVLDAVSSDYDRQRNQAALGANDAATQAGAFGGDRHALMVGERQGALDRGEMQDMSQLRYQGFNDAQQRAQQAANFGLGAAGQAFSAGDYMRNVQQQGLTAAQNQFNEARGWDDGRLGILAQGLGGPYGQTQSQPLTRNVGAGILGGAATGASIAGLPGAAVGGLLGLFG